jgi:hypothetical protein
MVADSIYGSLEKIRLTAVKRLIKKILSPVSMPEASMIS